MKIKVLGSSGAVAQGKNTAAFLVDDFLLLDAGNIALSLNSEALSKIKHIFLTHTHLDHIKAMPFLIENLSMIHSKKFVSIYSGRPVIQDLIKHIFNDRIWPDFTKIPSPQKAILRYCPISTTGFIQIDHYRIYATRVNHTVPAYGYLIEDADRNALVYTGDSGPTEKIWQRMKGHRVKGLIVEVSFPNALRKLAQLSKHLTPSLLKEEIRKMPLLPEKIFITHLKPLYRRTIEKELRFLKGVDLKILDDGMEIKIQ
jgi:ribonuclease BN (tRNA processing enzyme)